MFRDIQMAMSFIVLLCYFNDHASTLAIDSCNRASAHSMASLWRTSHDHHYPSKSSCIPRLVGRREWREKEKGIHRILKVTHLVLLNRYCIPSGIPAMLTEVLLASLLNYAIRYDLFAYTNLKVLTSEKTVLALSVLVSSLIEANPLLLSVCYIPNADRPFKQHLHCKAHHCNGIMRAIFISLTDILFRTMSRVCTSSKSQSTR